LQAAPETFEEDNAKFLFKGIDLTPERWLRHPERPRSRGE